MKFDIKDFNSALYVGLMRHFTPEQRKITQNEVEKLYIERGLYLRRAIIVRLMLSQRL